MQLSAKTINILKNFATINPSVVIKPGSVISTISPSKTIMARATVPDVFEEIYGIYALNRFISAISLIENPTVVFLNNIAKISDSTGDISIEFTLSDPSVILVPPEKEIKLPTVDVECKLSTKTIQSVLKGIGVLNLPEFAIVGDGNVISIKGIDSKIPNTDTYNINIGSTDRVFRAIFRVENIKLIDGDYDLKISSKGISQFIGTEATYWVAVESGSTF